MKTNDNKGQSIVVSFYEGTDSRQTAGACLCRSNVDLGEQLRAKGTPRTCNRFWLSDLQDVKKREMTQ